MENKKHSRTRKPRKKLKGTEADIKEFNKALEKVKEDRN